MATVNLNEIARGLAGLYEDQITAAIYSNVVLDCLLRKHWLVEFLEGLVIAGAAAAGNTEVRRQKFVWEGVTDGE